MDLKDCWVSSVVSVMKVSGADLEVSSGRTVRETQHTVPTVIGID